MLLAIEIAILLFGAGLGIVMMIRKQRGYDND